MVLHTDDATVCAKAVGTGKSWNIWDAVGAEAQAWLPWSLPDARVHGVEPLQALSLSSGGIAKRPPVTARVEDGLRGGEAEQKASVGDWLREDVGGKETSCPGGPDYGTLCKLAPSLMTTEPWRVSRSIEVSRVQCWVCCI